MVTARLFLFSRHDSIRLLLLLWYVWLGRFWWLLGSFPQWYTVCG